MTKPSVVPTPAKAAGREQAAVQARLDRLDRLYRLKVLLKRIARHLGVEA